MDKTDKTIRVSWCKRSKFYNDKGGYVAHVVEHPALIAQGDTFIGTLEKLVEAAKEYFNQDIPVIWRNEIKRLRLEYAAIPAVRRFDYENSRLLDADKEKAIAAYLFLRSELLPDFPDFKTLYEQMLKCGNLTYTDVELFVLKHHKRLINSKLVAIDPNAVEEDERTWMWCPEDDE